MLRYAATILSLLFPGAACAQAPVSLHATYDTYAAGIQVAKVEAGFSLGPSNYHVELGYRTTGVVEFLFGGHQFDVVNGVWNGLRARPFRFVGQGSWRGVERQAEIEYWEGKPIIRRLVPPSTDEREPVPEVLRTNTIDTLSALAELIRVVDTTGRCETAIRTYDGRRAVEIEGQTVGQEVLTPTSRSSFAGNALRCNFLGRMKAGFLFSDERDREGRLMHGSSWFATVGAGGFRLPVRMEFETKWFGDATMYLTGIGPSSDVMVARSN